jgi:hypothetical protein
MKPGIIIGGSTDQYGFVYIGGQKFVPIEKLETANARIKELEEELSEARKEVRRLKGVIEEMEDSAWEEAMGEDA